MILLRSPKGVAAVKKQEKAATATFESDYGVAAEGATSSFSGQQWAPTIPKPSAVVLKSKRSGSAEPMAASPAVQLTPYAHRNVKLAPRREKKRLRVLKEEEEYDDEEDEEHPSAEAPTPTESATQAPGSEHDGDTESEAPEELILQSRKPTEETLEGEVEASACTYSQRRISTSSRWILSEG